jgi:thiol:disulfide interchange protein DsbC
MRRFLLIVSLLLCFFCLSSANPSFGFETKGRDCSKCHTLNSSEATDLLKPLIPNLKVLDVSPSQMKGLWEVYVESGGKKGMVYIDFPKKHFLSGALISISDKRNLTMERLAELNRVDVSQIPLNDAVVMGDPKAKIRIVSFDDPD